MPIYEYRCADCQHLFEELVGANDEREALPCPSCQSRQTRRQMSVFAGHGGDAGSSGAAAGHSCGSPSCCRVPR